LNIAEECGQTKLQFKRYLNTAKGSVRECIAIITLSKMRRYITQDIEDKLRNQCIQLSKMVSGFKEENLVGMLIIRNCKQEVKNYE